MFVSAFMSIAAAAEPAVPSEATAQAPAGVVAYPASFFADRRPSTALDMVLNIPGFGFSRGASSVRGYAGSAGNVLIDGARPTSKSDTVDEVLRRIPASAVERIEVIRGAAPGVDMQGQQVLANVIRRRGASRSSSTAFGAQHAGGRTSPSARFEWARQAPGRSYDGSVGGNSSFIGSDSGRRTSFAPNGRPFLLRRSSSDSHSDGFDGAMRAELKLDEAATLRANLTARASQGSGQGRSQLTAPAGEPRGSEAFGSEFRNAAIELGGSYERGLGPRTRASLIASQRLGVTEYVSTFATAARESQSSGDAMSGESILRGALSFRRSPTLSIEAGAEGAYNFLDESYRLSVQGAPVTLPSQNVRVAERRAEAFVQGAWRARPEWTVDAGSRFEISTIGQTGDVEKESTFFFAKPRLLVTYAPSVETQWRFRLERSVGQLNFSDFVSSAVLDTLRVEAGNPELEPERAWTASLGFERRFWTRGAVTLGFSHSVIDQVIDRIPIFSRGLVFDAPGNIGRARSDTLSAGVTLPTDKLGLPGGLVRFGASRNWSEVTDPVTGEGRPISNRVPFLINGRFSQDLKRWRTSWSVNAAFQPKATAYAVDEINELETSPSVSATVEYKPSARWAMSLSLAPPGDGPVYRRTVYTAPRDRGVVSFVQESRSDRQGAITVRVRRTR